MNTYTTVVSGGCCCGPTTCSCQSFYGFPASIVIEYALVEDIGVQGDQGVDTILTGEWGGRSYHIRIGNTANIQRLPHRGDLTWVPFLEYEFDLNGTKRHPDVSETSTTPGAYSCTYALKWVDPNYGIQRAPSLASANSDNVTSHCPGGSFAGVNLSGGVPSSTFIQKWGYPWGANTAPADNSLGVYFAQQYIDDGAGNYVANPAYDGTSIGLIPVEPDYLTLGGSITYFPDFVSGGRPYPWRFSLTDTAELTAEAGGIALMSYQTTNNSGGILPIAAEPVDSAFRNLYLLVTPPGATDPIIVSDNYCNGSSSKAGTGLQRDYYTYTATTYSATPYTKAAGVVIRARRGVASDPVAVSKTICATCCPTGAKNQLDLQVTTTAGDPTGVNYGQILRPNLLPEEQVIEVAPGYTPQYHAEHSWRFTNGITPVLFTNQTNRNLWYQCGGLARNVPSNSNLPASTTATRVFCNPFQFWFDNEPGGATNEGILMPDPTDFTTVTRKGQVELTEGGADGAPTWESLRPVGALTTFARLTANKHPMKTVTQGACGFATEADLIFLHENMGGYAPGANGIATGASAGLYWAQYGVNVDGNYTGNGGSGSSALVAVAFEKIRLTRVDGPYREWEISKDGAGNLVYQITAASTLVDVTDGPYTLSVTPTGCPYFDIGDTSVSFELFDTAPIAGDIPVSIRCNPGFSMVAVRSAPTSPTQDFGFLTTFIRNAGITLPAIVAYP